MKRVKAIISLLALLVCAVFTGAAQKKAQLQVGDKWHYEQKVSIVSQMEIQGDKMDLTDENILGSTYEVLAVNEGTYDIRLTFSSIKFHATTPMGGDPVSFDSQKKEDMDGDLGEKVKRVIGKSFVFTLDANSRKITSIKERPQKDAGEPLPPTGPEPAIERFPQDDIQLSEAVEEIFGAKIQETNLVQGYKWNKNNTVNKKGLTTVSNTSYIINRIEGNKVYVDLTSNGSIEGTPEGSEQMGEMKISGRIAGAGNMIVDETTRLLVESKLEDKGKSDVKTPMGDQKSTDITTTTKLFKKLN